MTVHLKIKAVAGASRDGFGFRGEMLKMRVKAPAEKGRANTALVRLLADSLDLPVSAIRIVAGFSSPYKTMAIDDLTEQEVRRRLQIPG